MNKSTMVKSVAAAAALIVSGAASASPMYIDLTNIESVNGNVYDVTIPFVRTADAGSQTGEFTEFGFSQFLATSIYDFTDGSIFGTFFDTNNIATLTGLGVPASGLSLDGTETVNLVLPDCPAGQCDIDALSPLVPPLGSDNEGFLTTWDLQAEYTLNGTLNPGGPVYTSGTLDIYFNSLIDDADDQLAFSGTLTGSNIQAANLDLFFDLQYAAPGFLWVDQGGGNFVDASLSSLNAGDPTPVTLALDTNVNPPIPTGDQLLLVGTNAIRQTTLDGSITAQIPVPGTLALLGLGLAGLGGSLRRRSRS